MEDKKPTYWNIEDCIEYGCHTCGCLDTDIIERNNIDTNTNYKSIVLKCNYCGAAIDINPDYNWSDWIQRRNKFRATHTINNIKRTDDMGNDIYEIVTSIKA